MDDDGVVSRVRLCARRQANADNRITTGSQQRPRDSSWHPLPFPHIPYKASQQAKVCPVTTRRCKQGLGRRRRSVTCSSPTICIRYILLRWFTEPSRPRLQGRERAYIHPPNSCAPRIQICLFLPGRRGEGTGVLRQMCSALRGGVILWN